MASECGAPEFFSGAKLIGVAADGKFTPEAIAEALAGLDGSVHSVKPCAVSLSQASELGTVYTPGEIAAIAALAHDHGLKLHMDGARFANAMSHLGCPPAQATWKCGVDVLSFGATKAGALGAEAVVFFDPNSRANSNIAANAAAILPPRCAMSPPSSPRCWKAICG